MDAALIQKKVEFAEKVMEMLEGVTDTYDDETLGKIGLAATEAGLMVADEAGDRIQVCVPVTKREMIREEGQREVEVMMVEGMIKDVDKLVEEWKDGAVWRVIGPACLPHSWLGKACTKWDFAPGTKVWLWNSVGNDFMCITTPKDGEGLKRNYIKPFIG